MASTILLAAFFAGFPILVIWLGERRYAFVDRIGAAIVCYAVGIVVGNVGILPPTAGAVQDLVSNIAVPLALPLVFFSLDVRGWRRAGGKALLSFGLEIVAVVAAVTLAFVLLRGAVGGEAAKVAGMLAGVYTGGTVNLAAIGTALRVSPASFVAANTADMAISALYLLLILTAGRRLLALVLPRSKPASSRAGGAAADPDYDDGRSFAGMFSRPVQPGLLAALGVAVLIAGIGLGLTFLLPAEWGIVAAILAITTLGIGASFVPAVRRIRKTHQLGQYFILVFCLAVGSTANIAKLATAAPAVLAMVAVAVFGSLAIHVALSSLFRIETDIVIITSVAGIFSPPFVPMVAASLKNRDVLVPGLVAGIAGWVIGTYLGIALCYALPAILP